MEMKNKTILAKRDSHRKTDKENREIDGPDQASMNPDNVEHDIGENSASDVYEKA